MESPKHLKEIFRPTGRDDTEGDIVCSCGCKTFGMKYYGEPYKGYIRVHEVSHLRYGLVIKAVCTGCKKEWLLFDYGKHGYNGYICREGEGVVINDSELKDFTTADDDSFEVKIGFEIDDEEQFLEEVVEDPPEGMSFTLDDRPDIWSWVVIDLKGAKSGKEYHFVDEELA